MGTVLWSVVSSKAALQKLHVDADKGLSNAEVLRRQKQWGVNEIAREKRFSLFSVFVSQFKSTLIYILLIAAGISFALQHATDAWVILAAVIGNVVIGFIQEVRAENALSALNKIVTFTARVFREGQERAVDPRELVPGDIVFLHAGARVPADVRLLSQEQLQISEAALTGESVPVSKVVDELPNAITLVEKKNMAFFGTTVIAGTGKGVVVTTGFATEIGKIADLLAATRREETPLQHKLQVFSRRLAFSILAVSLLLFVVGVALGQQVIDMFTTSVAIAVAAIPEGLVVVLTVILAIGMKRILARNALVRKLVAAETLGSTTVICTDKTGTLTEGEMRVVSILADGHEVHVRGTDGAHKDDIGIMQMLRYGVLCSDATIDNPSDALHELRIFGDPTERAIAAAAVEVGILRQREEKSMPRVAVTPFSSDNKFMATAHTHGRNHLLIIKGAPEILLSHVTKHQVTSRVLPLSQSEKMSLQKKYQALSANGLRMLAVAYANSDKPFQVPQSVEQIPDLVFLGFFCLQDPVRSDVKATLEETTKAGIRTIMLTGDNRLTAQAIAREVGLPADNKNILNGDELESLSQEALHKKISSVSVYSRVTPKDKLRIIDAWQSKGAVVAMTGDGVNDAPALKAADIGIALGSGTDVAKETADMVLLKNDFSVIVHAIEEGRIIFANIKKVILYLMSDSFTEMVLIAGALFFGLPLPLLASQILWVNLVSDGLPAIALTAESKEVDVMKEAPVLRGDPLFNKNMQRVIIVISLVTGLVALAMFYWWLQHTGDLARARTVTFLAVSLDSLVYVFSVRMLRKPIWRQSFFSNPWLLIAVGVALIVQLVAVYTPFFQNLLHTTTPHTEDWAVVVAFAAIGTITLEILKKVLKGKGAKNVF